jgi:hypothetical protein
MDSARWEYGPCTLPSGGEKREHPLRRNQQEAFPVRTATQEIYCFIIEMLRSKKKAMP